MPRAVATAHTNTPQNLRATAPLCYATNAISGLFSALEELEIFADAEFLKWDVCDEFFIADLLRNGRFEVKVAEQK